MKDNERICERTMKKKFWTNEDRAMLVELFPNMRTQQIADLMGRGYSSISNQANLMGLHKSPEFRESEQSGRITKLLTKGAVHRFKKGQEPPNKGKPMPDGVYQKAKATMFKKGSTPANAKHDGYERLSKDGYIEVRVRQGKFRAKHHLIWEEINGPIPFGMIVVFRDKNPLNLSATNLELISRAENMKRNTFHRYPPELKQTIRLVSKLKRLIHEKQD